MQARPSVCCNDLVDWFNKVDATYGTDLLALNELNFARFDAKLGEGVSGLDSEFKERWAKLDSKIDLRCGQPESRIHELRTELVVKIEQRAAQLESKIDRRTTELIKWMFMFWLGTLVPLAGLTTALS